MRLHAFVAMPFGQKPGPDGTPIDFNAVYRDLLHPAIMAAGLDPFRADQEQQAGDIKADMFQELLIADLVVADLTLDNPNVWYELGIRHALRARGIVLVQGPRESQPFDLYTDRKLCYHLKDGLPDPALLEADRAALTAMITATIASWHGRKLSPVYQLLDELEEPDWRRLLLTQRNEFSDAQRNWRRRVDIAGQKNLAGDLLVLADETPTRALWLDAKREAAATLLKLQHDDFALEHYQEALSFDPDDLACRQRIVVCLERTGRFEEARTCVEELIRDHPDDPECWALLGRVEKDRWIARWREPGLSVDRMRDIAGQEEPTLIEAIRPYWNAFARNPAHFYSGINALTLMHLQRHLIGRPDETEIAALEGGVLWSCLGALERVAKDYWPRASLAEFRILTGTEQEVIKEYRSAAATADRNWFALDSSRQTLTLLRDLQFRTERVDAALAIIESEIARSTPPWRPRQVFLFSGHMVDTPERTIPRFPAEKVPLAATKIDETLALLGAGPNDLALTQGAAGADILFAEACLRRGVKLRLLQPFDEPEFIQRSVVRCGEPWRDRYLAITQRLDLPPRAAPRELGDVPKTAAAGYAYERCNRWLLYTALAHGVDKVHFICLWDGAGGDGPGGTQHMYDVVKTRTGQVHWLDTHQLW